MKAKVSSLSGLKTLEIYIAPIGPTTTTLPNLHSFTCTRRSVVASALPSTKEGKSSGSKWEDDEWDEWKEMCAERGTVLEVTNDL